MKSTYLALIASIFALSGAPAHAQTDAYPSRPITIVVTFAPGSGSDQAARFYAKALKDKLNATVVVDNKPGAAGMIGAQFAARAAPDGYTLLMGSGTTNAANYPLYKDRISYKPQDFVTVAQLNMAPAILFAGKDVKGDTVAELLKTAKQTDKNLSCGNGNAVTQVACEILKRKTGADIVGVPYKGNAQSLTDLIGGQIPLAFSDLAAAAPFVQAGSIRPVAVAARTRVTGLPDVKTFGEQGIADFEFLSWTTVFAPAGTPRHVVAKLNGAARAMLESAEWEKFRATFLGVKVSGELNESQEFVAAEVAKWDRYVRESGIKGSD